jgi:hypothetical protein
VEIFIDGRTISKDWKMARKRTETSAEIAHGFVETYDHAIWQGISYARKHIKIGCYEEAVDQVIDAAKALLNSPEAVSIIYSDHPQVIGRLETIQQTLATHPDKSVRINWLEVFSRADIAERNAAFGASQSQIREGLSPS